MRKNRAHGGGHKPPIPAKDQKSRPGVFARSLMSEWQRLGLPATAESVVVAVSGGADSTALLLALEELSKTGCLALNLTVAHLDHGLRARAGAEDARWVEALAKELGFEFEHGRAAVKSRAASARDNLEQAARRARYEFLAGVAERSGARLVLTGHTMDDQAETVLLRLLRGSGAEGLGGMRPVRTLVAGLETRLARPLLRWARRADTEGYCRERKISFRVDEMNEDEKFARVRVRRELLPMLLTFNPRAVESLGRTAELLRGDASVLNAAAAELLDAASEDEKDGANGPPARQSLSVNILSRAPLALRRRALRLWIARERGDLRRLELTHLAGVEKLLEGERGGRVAELPGGSFIERRGGRLRLYNKRVGR
ncbi:MAG TPA: tRNA lysidine(34) synthetase TilS [Pyrinomonadaceae bacterium]